VSEMWSGKLALRVVLLVIVAVIVQEAVISQISIFGVNADVTPLIVMSVGLLTGSLPGAIVGFFCGLLVDTLLVQTLGVTSLLYIVIGYWSGRIGQAHRPSRGIGPDRRAEGWESGDMPPVV
jgi:rod shape-determining protein MreD